MAKVAVEKEGAITVVSIDRFAEARNAVDPETAVLLREAFLAFDADESQSVAILTGRGGTFCAGYDLKVAAGRARAPALHDPEAPGPMGPTRHLLVQAGDRRGRGLCRGGRARARAVVRHARGVRERQVRRVLPALGRAADRRRHGAPAAPDRPQPRPRHDPDRPRGRRPRGVRLGPRQPAGAGRPGAGRGQGAGRGRSRSSRRLCMRSDRRSSYEQWSLELAEALVNEGAAAARRRCRPRRRRAPPASPPARAAAATSATSDCVSRRRRPRRAMCRRLEAFERS